MNIASLINNVFGIQTKKDGVHFSRRVFFHAGSVDATGAEIEGGEEAVELPSIEPAPVAGAARAGENAERINAIIEALQGVGILASVESPVEEPE